MKNGMWAWGIVGFIMVMSGCSTVNSGSNAPTFQYSGGNPIISRTQFDETFANASNRQGQDVKLAGAVVRIDETEEGYLVLARWLPYPQKQIEEGPKVKNADDHRHFLLRFVGKREKKFHTTGGNKVLVDGQIQGTKRGLVNVFASRNNLLYVNAKCVHVWETGQVSIRNGAGDSDYPEPRERTLCAD